MSIFSLFINNFKKELQIKRRERLLRKEDEQIKVKLNTPKKEFSFTVDNSPKFDTKIKAIPELTALSERIKKDNKLSLADVETYFKYYENGHILNSDLFKIKKEFFEHALFKLDGVNSHTDKAGNIVLFELIVTDVITGLDVKIIAPASFFTEFTTTAELEKV